MKKNDTNQASLYEPTWRRKTVGVKANTAAPAMLAAREALEVAGDPEQRQRAEDDPGQKGQIDQLVEPERQRRPTTA